MVPFCRYRRYKITLNRTNCGFFPTILPFLFYPLLPLSLVSPFCPFLFYSILPLSLLHPLTPFSSTPFYHFLYSIFFSYLPLLTPLTAKNIRPYRLYCSVEVVLVTQCKSIEFLLSLDNRNILLQTSWNTMQLYIVML